MKQFDEAKAFIVGGGIASLAAAVLLIRNGELAVRDRHGGMLSVTIRA